MNLEQIKQSLVDIFSSELKDGKQRHIVFWYDPEYDFSEHIPELKIEGVRILHLTSHNSFFAKYEIEKVDPNSHFIVYSNDPKPLARQNLLIDIFKYSIEFSANKTSIIMRDLGITDESLAHVFKHYSKFFNNKERYSKFASYDVEEWTEESVHLCVLASLCKTDFLTFDDIVKKLFIDELNETNAAWLDIEKFGDPETFWSLVEFYYGYTGDQKSLQQLFITMCLSHLKETFQADLPRSWQPYVTSVKMNSIIFINQFMHHTKDVDFYNQWAKLIEEQLNVQHHMTEWKSEQYLESDTFPCFDKYFITSLSNYINEMVQDYDHYKRIIKTRRKLHWFPYYQHEYEALNWAITFLEHMEKCKDKLRENNALQLFEYYLSNYYLIDQAYRKFHFAFDQAQLKDDLSEVKELIENTYVNAYLEELSVYWSNAVQKELSSHWPIVGIKQQHNFYNDFIQPHVNRDEKVFVINSDAFRYEAAHELVELLNSTKKASTEIDAIQGVVPSYTSLGMASLLPHHSIEYRADQVKVDGSSTNGIINRQTILQKKVNDSIAVNYSDIKNMKRKLRDLMKGQKVIYIYHNTIDARGDHAATEHDVFFAVKDAIDELSKLIHDLVNHVSATNIYVTADHGFVYQQSSIEAYDKTSPTLTDNEIEKRRFTVTDSPEHREDVLTISLNYLLGADSELYTTVPRGTMRFARKGTGANFIHGGSMLQEIVIPVIKYKTDRSASDKNAVKKVTVQLTNISRKITSMITYLEFFQSEKVETKRLPIRLSSYIADEEGLRISNENTIIADSTSETPQDRTYKEKFVLKNLKYDKTKTYYLILEDENEKTVYDKIPFLIDLATSD
ncbi:BREX-1 system phosphatase PglZ type A [Alkalihalobacterium alkalinitrilicum]|uniref:BREX-1 system phosphatase PglZ type A n=1 Tax=Alkalihalobacterium alkalinitrilicum TaxID=427920 RepID=UPI0009958DB9|nr:BREX-1 system phosphatase PglZ type A [Alkalihalobacterium alkalinitrilicum]